MRIWWICVKKCMFCVTRSPTWDMRRARVIKQFRTRVVRFIQIQPTLTLKMITPVQIMNGTMLWRKWTGKIKNIERSVTFISDPYTFLLEICVSSNVISSQFGLAVNQQKTLIEGFIPPTSVLHKDLRLLGTLDQIFDQASINSMSILKSPKLTRKLIGGIWISVPLTR